jgi:hypothetical protein
MTKSFTLGLALLLLPVSPLLAQGQDDHDDNGPTLTGYAVVTTATSSTSGIGVVETFGLRRPGETSQAGVVPPPLVMSTLLFVDVSARLSKNVGVAIVNPNNLNTTVTLTLSRSDGVQLVTKTVDVVQRRQFLQFVTQMFPPPPASTFTSGTSLPPEFTGTLLISSTLPISVLGLRFRGLNFSTLPPTPITTFQGTLPVIAQGVGGSGGFLLPQFAAGGGWATEIIITNSNVSSVTVRIDLFDQNGVALTTALNGQRSNSFTNLTVPAGGALVFAPRDRNGDDDF